MTGFSEDEAEESQGELDLRGARHGCEPGEPLAPSKGCNHIALAFMSLTLAEMKSFNNDAEPCLLERSAPRPVVQIQG